MEEIKGQIEGIKMNRRNNRPIPIPAPVGGSSLLVIFAVLCLTLFALLGLTTVLADVRFADDSCEAVTAYYKADCEAEKILGRLRAGERVEGVEQEGSMFYYSCPVGETQILGVAVEIKEGDYSIKEWRVAETTEWKPDEYLELLDVDEVMERGE